MATNTFYSDAWTGYDTSLISGATTATNSLLGAAGPELMYALDLMVITYGILISLGRVDIRTGLVAMTRGVFIAAILTPSMYNQWVTQTAMVTLPNWIASALGNGGPQQAVTAATQFDLLASAINHMAASLLEAASSGSLTQMLPRMISIEMANEFAIGMITIAFIVDLVTQALVALVVPLGAVLLIAYLFQNTRHWAEKWIGKLVALMLLEVMIAVLLVIVLTQFRLNMIAMEGVAGGGVDLDEAIAALWAVCWDFFIGVFLLLALPAMAAAIGGSHVSSVVVAPLRMGSMAASQISTAVARGVSAGNARSTPTSNRAP